MVETHIVFQTIKLGDSGNILDNPTKEYFSTATDYYGILLADVKPFRIVGGHVSTNILHDDVSLLGVRLVANKYSIPILIDFHESIQGFQDNAIWQHHSLSYVTLYPKMKGYYWCGGGESFHKVDYELEHITHLYLITKENDQANSKFTSSDMVSMTLILEADPQGQEKDNQVRITNQPPAKKQVRARRNR